MSRRGGRHYEDPFAGVDIPLRWTAYFFAACITLLGVGFFVVSTLGKQAFVGNPSALWQVLAVCSAVMIVLGIIMWAITFAYRRKNGLLLFLWFLLTWRRP